MRKTIPCLALVLALLTASAAAESPIYVDGSGHIIDEGGTVIRDIDVVDSTDNPVDYTGDEEQAREKDPSGETGTGPNKWEYDPTVLTALYAGQEYEAVSVNTYLTVLKNGRTEMTVRTSDVSFPSEDGESVQLAMIDTPKSGRATMFKRASSKAAIINKCQTNRIVAVRSASKKFVKVHYEDAEGFVSAGSVKLLNAHSGEIETAVIAYRGNTKSRSTVKVRQKASGSSRALDEFACGTQVAVVARGKEWTEIEVADLHGFILTEFLTGYAAWTGDADLAASA